MALISAKAADGISDSIKTADRKHESTECSALREVKDIAPLPAANIIYQVYSATT